jgi:predicted transcriptional regulator
MMPTVMRNGDIMQSTAYNLPEEHFNPYKKFVFIPVPEFLLDADLTPGAKLLYGLLIKCNGKNNICIPTHRYLAKTLKVSERQISNYVNELKDFGLIETKRRGLNKSNQYYFKVHPLMLPEGTEPPPPEKPKTWKWYGNVAHLWHTSAATPKKKPSEIKENPIPENRGLPDSAKENLEYKGIQKDFDGLPENEKQLLVEKAVTYLRNSDKGGDKYTYKRYLRAKREDKIKIIRHFIIVSDDGFYDMADKNALTAPNLNENQ